jgi:hypothetical protein
MEKMIAYCGLVCSDCPAYVATQSGERDALEEVAAQWRLAFNAPEITAESIVCDGCPGTNGGRLAGYCTTCEIRACGVQREVANCAHCAAYGCAKLEGFLDNAPEARETLEEIRQSRDQPLH